MSGRRLNRLPSSDLEEDGCAVGTDSFQDFGGCDADIYSKSMVQGKESRGPRGGKDRLDSGVETSCDSGLGSILSAEFVHSSSSTSDLGLDRIPEDSILTSDFSNLSLGDSLCEECLRPGQTTSTSHSEHVHCHHGHPNKDSETVSVDDEAIGSITQNDELLHAQIFQQDDDGDTVLHLATIKGAHVYAHNMLYMATSEEQLNIQNFRQQTVLHLAVLTHQAALARTLVGCGAQLDVRDHWGNTALHLACRDGDLDCVQHLTVPLQQGEVPSPSYTPRPQCMPQDMTIKNYEGDTCLHLAASRGHLEVINYLVQHSNTDVNLQEGKSGRTVLHQAVESNNIQLVKFLLQLPGLQLEALTYDSRTALRLAVDRQLTEVTKLLMAKGADTSRASSDSSLSDTDEDLMEDVYSDFTIDGQPIVDSWS